VAAGATGVTGDCVPAAAALLECVGFDFRFGFDADRVPLACVPATERFADVLG
jgi:hypothetical protein